MNSSTFGDDSHYYAQARVPERKPGPEWDSPSDRLMRQILMSKEKNIQKRVERVCKNTNLAIREYLRSETALKLSQGEHRQAVPVYVVDGVPDLFADVISQAPDPTIWHLYNNREMLENIDSELLFINKYLPNILKFFQMEESGEKKCLTDTNTFIHKILHGLDEFELPRLIFQIEEDILGSYFFRIPAVYIYWMPIALVASILKVRIEDLTFVVLTHELAHAYTHRGADLGGAQWDTEAFARTSKYIIEGLAQFYTESICGKYVDRQPGVLDAFTLLFDRLPPIYTDYQYWTKEHTSEVIRFSMISARLNEIVRYEAFKTEMTEIEKRIQNEDT